MIIADIIQLYVYVIFARAIFSFFPIRYDSPLAPVVAFLHRITEPALAPIRRVLPPMSGLDLSPLVLIIGLGILSRLLTGLVS
jgi:YggT family protein